MNVRINVHMNTHKNVHVHLNVHIKMIRKVKSYTFTARWVAGSIETKAIPDFN